MLAAERPALGRRSNVPRDCAALLRIRGIIM